MQVGVAVSVALVPTVIINKNVVIRIDVIKNSPTTKEKEKAIVNSGTVPENEELKKIFMD